MACAITKLPFGAVTFEDIGLDTLKGQILKPLDKSQCPSPALGPTPRSEQVRCGRIVKQQSDIKRTPKIWTGGRSTSLSRSGSSRIGSDLWNKRPKWGIYHATW